MSTYNLPMQDRPSADELLAALEAFLDDLAPSIEGSRSFHTRVAANAVRIVRRELANEEEALAAEWAGLDAILGAEDRPAEMRELRERLRTRNEELCELIRRGDTDDGELAKRLHAHVRAIVRAKLQVTDPRLLERSPDSAF